MSNAGKRSLGLTVVELLIASSIVVIVLGLASIFLAQQAQMQKRVQTRNEVQDRVRVGMQLVVQDLALAGNSVVIDSTGAKSEATNWPFCFDGGKGCLVLEDQGLDDSAVSVRYLTSQFPAAQACRDVTYRLEGTTLQRSDVPCEADPAFVDLASDILEFKAQVICSTGVLYDAFPTGGCGGGTSYGRSMLVSLRAQSSVPLDGQTDATCPEERICFEMQQEVLIPNMKDQ